MYYSIRLKDKIYLSTTIRIFNEYEQLYKQSILLTKYKNEFCSINNNNNFRQTSFKKYITFNEDTNSTTTNTKTRRFSEGGRYSFVSGKSSRNSVQHNGMNFSLLELLESAANDIKDRKSIELLNEN